MAVSQLLVVRVGLALHALLPRELGLQAAHRTSNLVLVGLARLGRTYSSCSWTITTRQVGELPKSGWGPPQLLLCAFRSTSSLAMRLIGPLLGASITVGRPSGAVLWPTLGLKEADRVQAGAWLLFVPILVFLLALTFLMEVLVIGGLLAL